MNKLVGLILIYIMATAASYAETTHDIEKNARHHGAEALSPECLSIWPWQKNRNW